MLHKMRDGEGFIAALDQSGGSTPKALKLYGLGEDAYRNEAEMFDRIHEMRTRIITSPSFNGDRVLAAILFEMTMDRDIEGRGTADYLWNVKHIVPILKASLTRHLETLPDDQQVMFKLTLPSEDGFYSDLVAHPKVLRVVALSGGYSRDEANAKLARNPGVIASFSRALTEGLTAQQSAAEFDEQLDASVKSIYEASLT